MTSCFLVTGEPFIDGQPVPYDPKYHKVWVENMQMAEKLLIQPMKLKEQDPELSLTGQKYRVEGIMTDRIIITVLIFFMSTYLLV